MAAVERSDRFSELLARARAIEGSGAADEDVLAAFETAASADPSRAEALHDAARFARWRGLNERAAALALRGLALRRPRDAPGVEHWIYDWGLAQELSIAGYYQPETRAWGFAACDRLALSRGDVPEAVRALAQNNLRFYLEPATGLLPSFASRPVGFEAPRGWQATNPSIARRGDELVMVQRCVNYTVDLSAAEDDAGRYRTHDGGPIRTRNFLVRLDDDLQVRGASEILPPKDLPAPAWPSVQGFEDVRPFVWKDELWGVACARQLTPDGWCEQVLARVAADDDHHRLADWRVVAPQGPKRHEKNWMPFVDGGELRFLYLCDPTRVLDAAGRAVRETTPAIDARSFRGGSQLISFAGGWLALIHETELHDGRRRYRHRFVWFDGALELRAISRPFCFQAPNVEFAAGLAWRANGRDLAVSYGVGDCEAWIATVAASDVAAVLDDVAGPPGRPPAAIVDLAGGPSARPVAPVALCAIVKNEAPYIEEWVAFHVLQGVEAFLIFDNGSTDGTRGSLDRIRERIGERASVEVAAWPGDVHEAAQRSAYEEGARRLMGRAEWVGFVDIDEFLFVSATTSLPEALAEFAPAVSAVAIGHRIFGSSGRASYDAELVTARFTRCSGPGHPQSKWFKTLARPERVAGIDSAHSVQLTSGAYVMADHGPLERPDANWHPGLAARVAPGAISLNHYMVKSFEEYRWKQRRFAGKGLEHRYTDDHFREHDAIGDEVERRELAELAGSVRALIDVWRREADASR